jgi:hypothetical protein
MPILTDPTPDVVARLRRLVAEPTTAIYSDEDLKATLRQFPTARRMQADALFVNGSNAFSVVVWDVHAAAAQIWEEKIAALVVQGSYDITADGQTLNRDQKLQQYRAQLAYHQARRRVRSVKITAAPSRTQLTLEQRIEQENTEP